MSKVLSLNEFRMLYSPIIERGAGLKLKPKNVPESLRPLVHYAEFWGVSDDADRFDLVDAAGSEIRRNLRQVVDEHDTFFTEWLAGPAADDHPPSIEYVAFTLLRMASDLISPHEE